MAIKDLTQSEMTTIAAIARRAAEIFNRANPDLPRKKKAQPITFIIDLESCHTNGCPLDLTGMLNADDFNLMHDVMGINYNINHITKQLENCFVPRFALRASVPA